MVSVPLPGRLPSSLAPPPHHRCSQSRQATPVGSEGEEDKQTEIQVHSIMQCNIMQQMPLLSYTHKHIIIITHDRNFAHAQDVATFGCELHGHVKKKTFSFS